MDSSTVTKPLDISAFRIRLTVAEEHLRQILRRAKAVGEHRDGDAARRVVLYQCPDGRPFARKHLPATSQVQARGYTLEDRRSGQTAVATVQADSHPLLDLLHAAPHSSEALAAASGWPLAQVLAALTELELEGLVANEGGRWLGRTG